MPARARHTSANSSLDISSNRLVILLPESHSIDLINSTLGETGYLVVTIEKDRPKVTHSRFWATRYAANSRKNRDVYGGMLVTSLNPGRAAQAVGGVLEEVKVPGLAHDPEQRLPEISGLFGRYCSTQTGSRLSGHLCR